MNLDSKIAEAQRILNEALKLYCPRAVFTLYSGGHDSVTASHLAFNTIHVDAAAHINTGIGIDETRLHARETAKKQGWRWLEYKAAENTRKDGTADPQVYRDIVLQYGFPGPPQHSTMYARLKERQVARLVRDHKAQRSDKIILITGVRQQESIRRMGHVKPIQVDKARVWVAPFINFADYDVRDYMNIHSIARNPVVDQLGMSGECLCGAFAKKGELTRIGQHYPEKAAEISQLEDEVTAAGFPWGWEDQQPKWYGKYQDGQDFLSDDFMPLCMSCPSRNR